MMNALMNTDDLRRRARRLMLKGLLSAPVALSLTAPAHARTNEPRSLAFYHTHTDERLQLVYFEGGRYVPEALTRIDHFLRDFRTGEVRSMDPRLLDMLHVVCQACGAGTFEIISGYRSAHTNTMLRNRGGRGVAKRSLHMEGRAIDVRLSGRDTARLRNAAVAIAQGGVGYYPDSNFVHLDTGRPRIWGATPA
jgi:uncharacterized protein YcbK (DUF882 family)